MRARLVLAMVLSSAAVAAIMLLLHMQLLRFRRGVPEIRTPDDLARFKKLATCQMYASLLGLILMCAPPVIGLVGNLGFGQLSWPDLLFYGVTPEVLLFLLARLLVGVGRAVRTTPAADPALKAECERVAYVWLHRAFPEW